MSRSILRAVLALVGIAVVLLGINIGFGGIKTLGWQAPTDYITVADSSAFNTQDSHFRFLGGFWLAAGLAFLGAAAAPVRMRPMILGLCGMIFIGGIIRLLHFEPQILMSTDVAPSLILELVGFPLLGFWVHRATQPVQR